MKHALLIFTKNLEEGKVKTRLAATIGTSAALSVYKELLLHTERNVRGVKANMTVLYSDYIAAGDMWDENSYSKAVQRGADLGERMRNAIYNAIARGNKRVAVIGSDCLQLTEEIIDESFRQLEYHDIVIGPAEDGGYYLIAMKSLHEDLFRNMVWSTSEVLKDTLSRCRDLNLSVYCLQEFNDIDTEADLIKASGKLFYGKETHD
ncbi:TIGR04282 family arsenosugar biosynthesis glycosyltransferase [Daejeonella sp.]|uniref:TIGR04282 family arsenosugar biosynthesis glycosyltransferase n=1 Tax=Daejeonella sp. TaxID=2805397 RepID=UPI0030C2E498